MHIHELLDHLGHLRDLDRFGEVTAALSKVDELPGEGGLRVVGIGQEASEAGAGPEAGVVGGVGPE
ncbi:hypothetical protein ABZS95_43515, partial [Streptomyces sp. NPDC005479]|uniref:hypothetical protein n=1 Tax=unclassified Streptomyces TaxID=2593676 RepID=UPI0033BE83DF